MKPAIFLDRDGVIIEDRPDYVRSWADVEIFPQALEVLEKVSQLPYSIVLVTNQSGVGRGLISLETAQGINRQLVDEIEQVGGRIDGIYMCHHAPWEGCDCRKPEPGLIFQAVSELSLDLTRSVMVGDALSDIIAARSAGVARQALVRTGRGATQAQLPQAELLQPLLVFEDLMAVLKDFLSLNGQKPTP